MGGEQPAAAATQASASSAPDSASPQTFPSVSISGVEGAPSTPGTLSVDASQLRWAAEGSATSAWTASLSDLNLHALSTEAGSPHVYVQLGDDFAEVRFRAASGGAPVLQAIYDAICAGMARCPPEDEGDDENGVTGLGFGADGIEQGTPAGLDVLSRLDGLVQVDEQAPVPEEIGDGDSPRTEGNGVAEEHR